MDGRQLKRCGCWVVVFLFVLGMVELCKIVFGFHFKLSYCLTISHTKAVVVLM